MVIQLQEVLLLSFEIWNIYRTFQWLRSIGAGLPTTAELFDYFFWLVALLYFINLPHQSLLVARAKYLSHLELLGAFSAQHLAKIKPAIVRCLTTLLYYISVASLHGVRYLWITFSNPD